MIDGDERAMGPSALTRRVRRIGPYLIVSKLGEGGMGKVYLGRHTLLNVHHAIKVLPASLASNEMFVKRFMREASQVARLNHRNIVRVHAADEHNGVHYMAMEYVPGQTLQEFKDLNEVSVQDAVRIASQVASALAHAHEHGVIHRDVKPENVQIALDGTAHLMDFGLCREVEPGSEVGGLTMPGVAIGTPHFMSPEQLRGEEVDHFTDIYALGVTLYHILSGHFPYEDQTLRDVTRQRVSAEPIDVHCPNLDRDLTRLIHKMVHPVSVCRPASAGEVEETLTAWLARHVPDAPAAAQLIRPASSEVAIARIPVHDSGEWREVRDAIGHDALTNDGQVQTEDGTRDDGKPSAATRIGQYALAVHEWVPGQFQVRNSFSRIFLSDDRQRQSSVLLGHQFLASPAVRARLGQHVGEFANLAALFVHEVEFAPGCQSRMLPFLHADAPRALVIATRETRYGIGPDLIEPKRFLAVDSLRNGLRMPTKHRVLPLCAPQCSQAGSVMYYDVEARTLFSGSIGSGFVAPWKQDCIATADDWHGVRAYHQLFLPSSEALTAAITLIRQLDPPARLIAPSRGLLIGGDLVDAYLEWLLGLTVGPTESDLSVGRAGRLREFNELLAFILAYARDRVGHDLRDDLGSAAELRRNLDFRSADLAIRGLGPESIELVVRTARRVLPPSDGERLCYTAYLESERLKVPLPRLLI